ncbi:Histone-lysine N-methyltransferase SETMAR [Eumeta japonica]|uniref:Histone-lysine N-methyltransferase SETMAR n=1 Tax=Eumeta variegata TaxID=151549 RepID=A0A4C1YLJ0_EUMVA|nr:Histone-lysine N-methyltransferase SETMAR [Eumeta japonica]
MLDSNCDRRVFNYKKGKNVTQSAKKTCAVYRPNAVSARVTQNWFKRFQSGNFDVKNEPRSDLPDQDEVNAVVENVEQARHISSYDIAKELGIDHKTVLTHLTSWIYKKAQYLGPIRAH